MTIRTGLLFSLLFLLISGFQCFAKEIQTSTDLLNEIAHASKKQVVLVNFYASWCSPCRQEIADLIEIRKTFSQEQLKIIGINLDEDEETMRSFNRDIGINYETYHDFQGQISVFFNFQGIPFNIIYGKNGKAVYAQSGSIPFEKLSDLIEYGLTK